MDLTSFEYKIITSCDENILKSIVHEWWDSHGYDKSISEVYTDDLPEEFHSRCVLKDIDGGPATLHNYFSIKTNDTKNILKIEVEMGIYVKSAQRFFSETVCEVYSLVKKKDSGAELKKGIFFQRKVDCHQ